MRTLGLCAQETETLLIDLICSLAYIFPMHGTILFILFMSCTPA